MMVQQPHVEPNDFHMVAYHAISSEFNISRDAQVISARVTNRIFDSHRNFH